MSESGSPKTITIETTINAELARVWDCYTQPEHITQWNFAAPEWCCPAATNDPTPGGKFLWRMEARDGSMGFDFSGTFEEVVPHEKIVSRLDDGRRVEITFGADGGTTRVVQTFEIEDQNPAEMQRGGWQAILDNFGGHVERG